MGAYLTKPNKEKTATSGESAKLRYATAAMQASPVTLPMNSATSCDRTRSAAATAWILPRCWLGEAQ